jgi:putative toxin-antitoxin system antitoxin component (TIGR02293 family)
VLRVHPTTFGPAISDPGAKFLDKTALETRLQSFRGMALAPNTLRGYRRDWKDFATWCQEQGRECLSADTVSLYFADRSAQLTAPSLTRRIAAISKRHAQAVFLSPTKQPEFREVMAGIRKSKKDRPQTAKAALLNSDLIEIFDPIAANDARDRPQAARARALRLLEEMEALCHTVVWHNVQRGHPMDTNNLNFEQYIGVSPNSSLDLAEIAEKGLPTESIAYLKVKGLTFSEVSEIVISPRTLKHRKARGEPLSLEETDRMLRVARIIALAEHVFGNHEKVLIWLRQTDERIKNRTPLSMLHTESGGRLVENMLWQIDEGVYS